MNALKIIRLGALLLIAGTLSGCYTVLKPPFAQADAREREQVEPKRQAGGDFYRGDYSGDYTEYGNYDGYDEYEEYAGAGYDPYNDGYLEGPVFGAGYNAGYGGYGYGYGGPSYFGYGPSYGAGSPYGYGRDPYYSGSGSSYYIPPGYELVPSNELDRLRSPGSSLANQPLSPEAAAAALKTKQNKERETWTRRSQPRVRRADPTPRPSSVAPASTTRSTSSTSTTAVRSTTPTSSSSKSTSSSSSGKKSATPKKRRR
jgi:hypothetical protein